MLTGTTTTTTGAVPIENAQGLQEPAQPSLLQASLATEPVQQEGNQTGAGEGGATDTQGDEGLAEEAQVVTACTNTYRFYSWSINHYSYTDLLKGKHLL
jgi:hypothetical protein